MMKHKPTFIFKKLFEIHPIKEQAEKSLVHIFRKMRTANSLGFRKKDADVRIKKSSYD
jgi:hypothetical protein